LGVDDARESARQLQDRTGLTQPPLPQSADALITGIRVLLLEASDDETLASPPHEILRMLTNQRCGRNPEVVMVWCGETFDDGQAGEFLRLSNGSRLSFSFTAEYARQARRLTSYRFHLRRPDGSHPAFLRFDLNGEHATHEPLDEPRCHFHPGNNDVRIQCPILSPAEILQKCLYGV
jgi:hypothetical protein